MFRIWSKDRSNERTIVVDENYKNLLRDIIEEGSKELGIRGKNLIFESDSTQITPDKALQYIMKRSDILILLSENETWIQKSSIVLADGNTGYVVPADVTIKYSDSLSDTSLE